VPGRRLDANSHLTHAFGDMNRRQRGGSPRHAHLAKPFFLQAFLEKPRTRRDRSRLQRVSARSFIAAKVRTWGGIARSCDTPLQDTQ
jgi:hypothetical protein